MGLRGGLIEHWADFKTPAVQVDDSTDSFGPHAVEDLVPYLGCSHLLTRAHPNTAWLRKLGLVNSSQAAAICDLVVEALTGAMQLVPGF